MQQETVLGARQTRTGLLAASPPLPPPPQPPAGSGTPLPTSINAPWLLSPEPSAIEPGGVNPPNQHPGQKQHTWRASGAPPSSAGKLKVAAAGSEDSCREGSAGTRSEARSSPLAGQVSGFPDILYRPTAGPEILGCEARARAPLALYCCNCGYRGFSSCRRRCGLARVLWAAATLGLGLACGGVAADVCHHCPSCRHHVATSRYL